jgi:hypothetical protein
LTDFSKKKLYETPKLVKRDRVAMIVAAISGQPPAPPSPP